MSKRPKLRSGVRKNSKGEWEVAICVRSLKELEKLKKEDLPSEESVRESMEHECVVQLEYIQNQVNSFFEEYDFEVRWCGGKPELEAWEITNDRTELVQLAFQCLRELEGFKAAARDGEWQIASMFALQVGLDFAAFQGAREYRDKHSRSDQKEWEMISHWKQEGFTDGQVAIKLNDAGFRKSNGEKLTREDVKSRRNYRKKKNGKPDTKVS